MLKIIFDIIGIKVTAILLKGWILPNGGSATGRVCVDIKCWNPPAHQSFIIYQLNETSRVYMAKNIGCSK